MHAEDAKETNAEHEEAYTKVHGLGSVTTKYFCPLLGTPGVNADAWIVAAGRRAVERKVSPPEAREIVIAAAEALNESPT